MEKINLTVTSVKVYDNVQCANVEIKFDTPIKGFVCERNDDGKALLDQRIEQDVTTISINRAKLTRELCAVDALIDEYRGARSKAFDQAIFAGILRGSVLTVVRTRYSAGDPIEGAVDSDGNQLVHQHDGYDTKVVAIQMNGKTVARINAALDAAFAL